MINILFYISLLLFTLKISHVENKDIKCPTFDSSQEECERFGGMAYSYTAPEPNDSCDQLFDKIKKASGAYHRSIKWRRSFVMAVGITFALFLLLISPGKLPEWNTFILACGIVFVIILGNFIYYDYHFSRDPIDNVKGSVEILKERFTQFTK